MMLWTWQLVNPSFWFALSDALSANPDMAEVDANTDVVVAHPHEVIHDLTEVLREWQGWRTFVVRYYPEYPLNIP